MTAVVNVCNYSGLTFHFDPLPAKTAGMNHNDHTENGSKMPRLERAPSHSQILKVSSDWDGSQPALRGLPEPIHAR